MGERRGTWREPPQTTLLFRQQYSQQFPRRSPQQGELAITTLYNQDSSCGEVIVNHCNAMPPLRYTNNKKANDHFTSFSLFLYKGLYKYNVKFDQS